MLRGSCTRTLPNNFDHCTHRTECLESTFVRVLFLALPYVLRQNTSNHMSWMIVIDLMYPGAQLADGTEKRFESGFFLGGYLHSSSTRQDAVTAGAMPNVGFVYSRYYLHADRSLVSRVHVYILLPCRETHLSKCLYPRLKVHLPHTQGTKTSPTISQSTWGGRTQGSLMDGDRLTSIPCT